MLTLLLSLLLACSSETTKTEPKQEKHLSKEEITKPIQLGDPDGRTAALAPSPMESRLAAEKAGLKTPLKSLIPERDFDLTIEEVDNIALRTGVLLADTVLLVEELPKNKLVANIAQIEQGLMRMNAGKGLLETVAETRIRVTNDALTRKELLSELDDIISISVPGEGVGRDDNTGPLLQAGAWIATINLMGKAMLKDNKTDVANTLFRHAHVVEYFLLYTNTEGKEKAPKGIIKQLKQSLTKMKTVSQKKDITREDIQQIVDDTNLLLNLV